ncbi:tyrosinase family protein [Marinomonas mediterranea]|jgi:Common central domain of tyrosinase./Polyphenol oxidase middle domain.|uniref:Tyrosinase n=1 Tax=Marinomonas mediterranea (strain ATCC 700492 / JCM 21426 / NBRC 103028 / MMB-1) TaxID=717774 RepID=F2JZ85_MARM1|nr:tyrosinase family protein [Marinomonas mediterranea]ADZ93170.1 tyrosinase [Marinomonas mediterranea MMB-1]WCN15131.1 tyrosinase family protein [Marinomonas mediterranea]WCN19174.1 tyrosinase family protein [Marinomonas mediterranea MMB-1]
MIRVRKNVNELTDDTLLWYSKAVESMKQKDITDPSSWWYQGAIHGYGLDKRPNLANNESWSESSVWEQAEGFPPSEGLVNSQFWQQCQHGTWFFLPWHRMYLQFFEAIVAKTVVELGGPKDWTLPYWNYCDANNPALNPTEQLQALKLPSEFGTNTPNPDFPGLWMKERAQYQLSSQADASCSVAMKLQNFTASSPATSFGGVQTGFSHDSGTFGAVENNPHNLVHVDIGGAMGDPNTAALDPIFWLHHANIDRLWQCWIDQGRENTNDITWLNQVFDFHNADSLPDTLSVKDVLSTEALGFTYSDSYSSSAAPTDSKVFALASAGGSGMFDTIAATTKPFLLGSQSTSAQLEFLPEKQRAAQVPVLGASNSQTPNQVIIVLDNVTGSGVVAPVSVYVKASANSERVLVGKIGLFGLTQSSTPSVRHAGTGISIELDVTDALQQLRSQTNWNLENLQIELEPGRELGNASVTVGRVSIKAEVV